MSNYNVKIWRIFACVGVLIIHIGVKLHLQGSAMDITNLFGYFGLIIFYMMSGYLSFFSKELQEGKIVRYWVKRAIKILPLYYFVIGIYFILETYIFRSVPIDETGFGWKRYIFLFFDLIDTNEKFWRNLGFTWTIQIFVVFYLVAPLLYKLINQYWKAWAMTVFFFVLSIVIKRYMGGNLRAVTYMHFCTMGLVLYFMQVEGKQKTTIFISVIALLLVYTLVNKENVLIDLDDQIYALLFMILFTATESVCIDNEIIRKIFDFLEPYTFTFYLMQGMVWEELLCKILLPDVIGVLCLVVGTCILTYVVYIGYEKPVQKCLKKILLGKN